MMEREYFIKKMEKYMMVNLEIIKKMGKELFIIQMVKDKKEYGKMIYLFENT